MTCVNNLYNLHKIRRAKINDDPSELLIEFEMSKPTGFSVGTLDANFFSRKLQIECKNYFYWESIVYINNFSAERPH